MLNDNLTDTPLDKNSTSIATLSDKLLSACIFFVILAFYFILVPVITNYFNVNHYIGFSAVQILLMIVFWYKTGSRLPSLTHPPSLKQLCSISIILIGLTLCAHTLVDFTLYLLNGIPDSTANPYLQELVLHPSMFLIMALIVAPLLEEIVYRHYLPLYFQKSFSETTSFVASAILFSIFHMSVVSFLPLFLFGVYLSFVYKKTQNIWYCIISHSVYNMFVLFFLL